MNANQATQGQAASQELAAIDDALCDIIQDQYPYLHINIERSLTTAIERLRKWREQNGYLD